MTIEEIEAALARALPMRTPRFGPDDSAGLKVSQLEDYLLEAAYVHGELEEALYWLDRLVEHFTEKVEQITGWEIGLPTGKTPSRVTREDVLRAKRQLDPVTFDSGARARVLREAVRRQISRFEYETGMGVISRSYTMISGG